MGDQGDGDESSPPSDQSEGPRKTCEYCGAVIDTSDWYPVRHERGPDGELRFYPFCSEDCQESWLDE